MIDVHLFLYHLRSFIDKHGISSDLPSRMKKLRGEVGELSEAIDLWTEAKLAGDDERQRYQHIQEIMKEACDVAIIAFHIMLVCGSVNPLWNMFMKLNEVAGREKYQQIAKGGNEQCQQKATV